MNKTNFFTDEVTVEPIGAYLIKRGRDRRQSFSRSYCSIGIRLCGSAKFHTDEGSFEVARGQLLYLPSGVSYSQSTEGESVISVRFNLHGTPHERAEILTLSDAEEVERLFCELEQVWNSGRRGYKRLCSSILYRILYLAALEAKDESSSESGDKLRAADEYIRANFREESISTAKLAALCYMSEGGFRRCFRAAYGVSPNEYQRLLRLEYGRAQLESGLYSVGEAALSSGFSDAKYFSREFSRKYGESPSDYLRRCLQSKGLK